MDIAWFGILNGSAINFLNIYAARLGASGFQIGLLGAVPALVSLFLSIPTGVWLTRRPITKAVFWTAALSRLGYLLWIPLPWLFKAQGQIWALIVITLLMGIPLCGLNVGFTTLFAMAVPTEWRSSVAGIRNAMLSITFMLTSLGVGYLLDHLPFPIGYQIVFGIGFLGGLMSTANLFFIRPIPSSEAVDQTGSAKKTAGQDKTGWRSTLRLDIWRSPYAKILLVFMGFHLTQYLALPLFPLFTVNSMHLNDAEIGIGTAIFYLTMLIGSTQLKAIERWIGHQKITGWGVTGMALYPIMMAFSHNAFHYYLLSAVGGFVWAMVGGAYANYLLECIPPADRPSHLAWYNLVLNACVLVGSLAGPLLSSLAGLRSALLIAGILRGLAGIAILEWGGSIQKFG